MSLNLLGVVARALRMLGELPAGDEPGPDEGADMLIAANAMKRAWFGTLIGPRLSPFAGGWPGSGTGTAGQAENGGEYLIGGSLALMLNAPANPRAGARFGAVDAGCGFAAHNLTVEGNGSLIGGASTAVLNTNGAAQRWWFRPDVGSWTAEADWASLASSIEFPDVLIAYFPAMLALQVAGELGADVPPDVTAGASEGRQALARTYARRGVSGLDPVIGLAPLQAPAQGRPG